MLEDLIDKYAWVKQIEAWTVAVIEGRTVDQVIHIYGGNPADSVGDYDFAQMFDLQGSGYPEPLTFHLQALHRGPQVVAIENNGWSGSLPEIARRCSAGGGRFFSIHWDIHAAGMLTQAIDGTVTAHFESLYPVSPAPPQPGRIRPAWAIGPETDVAVVWQTCLALMEQQTGVAFDPDWLTGQRATYRIPDPYWMLRDVENAEKP